MRVVFTVLLLLMVVSFSAGMKHQAMGGVWTLCLPSNSGCPNFMRSGSAKGTGFKCVHDEEGQNKLFKGQFVNTHLTEKMTKMRKDAWKNMKQEDKDELLAYAMSGRGRHVMGNAKMGQLRQMREGKAAARSGLPAMPKDRATMYADKCKCGFGVQSKFNLYTYKKDAVVCFMAQGRTDQGRDDEDKDLERFRQECAEALLGPNEEEEPKFNWCGCYTANGEAPPAGVALPTGCNMNVRELQ